MFNLTRDPIGEKRMIERAFGVGPCVMAEAVAIIEESLAAAKVRPKEGPMRPEQKFATEPFCCR
jgi:hypothetical protein